MNCHIAWTLFIVKPLMRTSSSLKWTRSGSPSDLSDVGSHEKDLALTGERIWSLGAGNQHDTEREGARDP
jgi:hypothetical protein